MKSGLEGIGHIPLEEDAYYTACADQLGYRPTTKKEVWNKVGYIPLPHAYPIHASRSTHRIIAGGNRSGKTYCAAGEVIPYLFWWGSRGWIVSAKYDLADQLRREIQGFLTDRMGYTMGVTSRDLRPGQFYWASQEHRLSTWMNNSIELKSAESPDSMNAVPVDYIVLDEAALFPFLYYDTRLVPRLVDSGGWILSVGTFEWLQGEWFEEYFDLGQNENNFGISSFMMPTDKNFHVYLGKGGEQPEDVGQLYHTNWRSLVKNNSQVTWPLSPGARVIINNVDLNWLEKEKRRIDPALFASRYLAVSAGNQFRVFPSYKVSEFVDASKAAFDPSLPVYLAIDPGGTYAVLAIQLKRGASIGSERRNALSRDVHVCLIDELYFQTTVTTAEVFDLVKQKEWFKNLRRGNTSSEMAGVIDIMAPEIHRTWEQLGRKCHELNGRFTLRTKKVNINPGNQTLQHYLDTGTLWVHPNCKWFSVEMKRYHFKELSPTTVDTGDPRSMDRPKDEWNHAVRALVYFLVVQYGYYGRSATPAVVSPRRMCEDRR